MSPGTAARRYNAQNDTQEELTINDEKLTRAIVPLKGSMQSDNRLNPTESNQISKYTSETQVVQYFPKIEAGTKTVKFSDNNQQVQVYQPPPPRNPLTLPKFQSRIHSESPTFSQT